MKMLGVDFGSKRSGLAIADSRDGLAFARKPVFAAGRAALVRALSSFIKEENIELAVFGLPLGPDGEETEICRRIRNVAHDLTLIAPLQTVFVNERLTSADASAKLKGAGLKGKRIEEILDSEAAISILQSFIDKTYRKNNAPS